jgi:hypothetical protein
VAIILGVLCLIIGTAGPLSAAAPAHTPPDFTQGGKRDQNHDWLLGPTGAHGWVYGWKGQTAEARQILVTAVAAVSPVDGVLHTNDLILGVNGKPFADDARKSFARAATADASNNKKKGTP